MTEPFFEAIRRGDERAVDEAVAANADLLRARDGTGRSPVIAAAYDGHPQLAEHLAEKLEQLAGGLGYFEAATVGNVEAVRKALDGDQAAVDDSGNDGYSALHLAAWFGRLEVARLLLERGADPNAVAQNDARVTPLHSAVSARHRDLVSLLLALGASANVFEHDGRTPLHTAAHNGDEAIVSLLLLRGADPTRCSDDGLTPIDMAVEGGHRALAEMLREASEP